MADQKTPLALSPLLCTDFIGWLLQHHDGPTTLVICSSREAFLAGLHADARLASLEILSASPINQLSASSHPFLNSNIRLIATSRSIRLVFVPSLPHLRAYLATYNAFMNPNLSFPASTKPGTRDSILGIWGLAHLHRSTAEHSAQGLSRTITAATEAAALVKQKLVLAEPRLLEPEGYGNAEVSDGMSTDAWKEKVPLLSGSVRFGSKDRTWAGYTIEVGRIVANWCRFTELDQEAYGTEVVALRA